MSGRRRPPRYPGGGADGFGDEGVLSEEEVQRRVNLEGGGQVQAPPPEHKFRDRRPTPPPRRPRRTGGAARDSLLLVGLAAAGLVAVAFLLPKGPLAAGATAVPSEPGGTTAAVASGAGAASPAATALLITLAPGATTAPTIAPADTGSAVAPTSAAPTPRSTPRPTPRPSKAPSAPPTPRPTATPIATAKLIVDVQVVTDDGGDDPPAAWTFNVDSAGDASPSSFAGSPSGTTVTITANASYDVTTIAGPGGYTSNRSGECSSGSGGLPAPGSVQTCTITKDDIKPDLTVVVVVNNDAGGGEVPSDWTIAVDGTNVVPASFAGSATGTVVRLDANAEYSVSASNGGGDGYSPSQSGICQSAGLSEGASPTCTLTFTYVPPAPTPALAVDAVLLLPLLAAHLRGRRRWTTRPPG